MATSGGHNTPRGAFYIKSPCNLCMSRNMRRFVRQGVPTKESVLVANFGLEAAPGAANLSTAHDPDRRRLPGLLQPLHPCSPLRAVDIALVEASTAGDWSPSTPPETRTLCL